MIFTDKVVFIMALTIFAERMKQARTGAGTDKGSGRAKAGESRGITKAAAGCMIHLAAAFFLSDFVGLCRDFSRA